MDNLEFKTLLRHLGQDVGYMGLKLKKEVQKCVNELDLSHNSEKYCEKLAEIFTKFTAYTVEYANTLRERIKDAGKEQEYENIVKSLDKLTHKQEYNNCNDTGQNGECSDLKPPGTSGDDTLKDISEKVDLVLSQCSSIHIDNEFKEENLPQISLDENVPVNNQEVEDQGRANDTPNEKECNDDRNDLNDPVANFLELTLSEEQNADLNESIASQSSDDTFDKETVVNSPPRLDADDDQIADPMNEQLTQLCRMDAQEDSPNQENIAYISGPSQKESAVQSPVLPEANLQDGSSSSNDSDVAIIGDFPVNMKTEHSPTTHKESDSDIEVVEITENQEKDTNNLPLPNENIVKSSENVSTVNQEDNELLNKNTAPLPGIAEASEQEIEASNSDSDTTVDHLTPPKNRGSKSDDTVIYGNLPREALSDEGTVGAPSEVSQVFSMPCQSDQDIIEQSDKDNDVITQTHSVRNDNNKACMKANLSETIVESEENKENDDALPITTDVTSHWDSDVDYDRATQVASSSSPATTQVVEAAETEVSCRDSGTKTDCLGLTGLQPGEATCGVHDESNNAKVNFLKSLEMVPVDVSGKTVKTKHLKSSQNINFQQDSHGSDEGSSSSSVALTENIPQKSAIAEGVSKTMPRDDDLKSAGAVGSGDSDVFGDVSESESSPEGMNQTESKKKLEDEDKKALLKLISQYYRKRKKEKIMSSKNNDSSGEDGSRGKKKQRKSPRKRGKETAKIKGSPRKHRDKPRKRLRLPSDTLIDQFSSSSDEFAKDNMEIHEESSGSDSKKQESAKEDTIIDSTDSREFIESIAEKKLPDTALNKSDQAQPRAALEDDLEATQPYSKEPAQKITDDESQVVNPYKRKSVVPLPSSQSEPEPHVKSLSSQEESQVVCPFKRKSLKPIPSSETSEFEESQVIKCKRKAVMPLPSSQSDEEDTVDDEKKNEAKRPHSPTESDSDATEDGSTIRDNGTDDSSSDVVIVSSSSISPSDDHHIHKKRKVNSELNQEDSGERNEDVPTESEDSSPPPTSQFKLDEDGRDDLLDMLDRLANDTHSLAPENGVAETAPEPASQFKLCDSDRDNLLNLLTDKEKDETAETTDGKDEALKSDEVRLSGADRNELLDLLNDVDQDSEKETTETSEDDEIETIRNSDENSDNRDDANSERFKLDEDERNELLNLLSEHLQDSHTDSSDVVGSVSSSDSENDDVSAGQKRKASTNESKRKKVAKGINREVLLDLVKEYEEAVTKGTDINISDKEIVAIKNDGKMGTFTLDVDTDLDSLRSSDGSAGEGSYLDSSTDSILLDVLREEAVEENNNEQGGFANSKNESEEAWNAYQALLNDDEDEDISETSSEISDIDLEDLELDFADQERKRLTETRNAELRRQFGIVKELIINVEAVDISGFDIQTLSKQQETCSEIDSAPVKSVDMDRLCDLSDILGKKSTSSLSSTAVERSTLPTSSPDSSQLSSPKPDSDWSQSSDSEADDTTSLLANQNSFSNPDSPLHRALSDDDERERFANALFANIRNSSDENSGDSDKGDDSSSEEDEKKTKKGKALSLGAGESKKKSVEGDEDSDGGSRSDGSVNGSETDNNAESGDQEKKENVSKEVDLDSSDEEDFVGVRKGRGAWRHDPLLHECLTSDSDEDTDCSGSQKKLRKRKGNKSGQDAEGDSDSDATTITPDNVKTPVKKLVLSDESDDSDFEIIEKEETPQKPILITDDEDTPSKWGKGRRNIRALVQDDDLAEATQRAHNEEKERIRRLQERDKAKESLTQSQSFSSQLSDEEAEPLILDMTEDIQIKVHPKITQKLKPHQRNGIQFMWDSCYESIKQLKKGWQGSGCILAHCMGLGKTLQALALIQTLFAYPITKTKHVLVVCPLSTVSNWRKEYNLAFKGLKHSQVKLYTIEDKKAARRRFDIVEKWWKTGGMLVMGYECFGLLIDEQKLNKFEVCHKESILEAMLDPGPDLIICDEGHLLRNKQSQRTLALNRVKTRRRIILTGTPLQNNLLEYYYMVHFVKPNLLGTEKEYKTNFVNPISNGQFEDSTAEDIMFMKKRTHVLHKLLNRTVQRVEDTELKQYLPNLIDQAVFIKLSDLQVNLYNTYLDSENSRPVVYTKKGNISHKNFLADVQILRYICIHPNVVTTAEKDSKAKVKEQDIVDDNLDDVVEQKVFSKGGWYKGLLTPDGSKKLELGSKMVVVIDIVKEAAACGDKVLIFSQSYAEMENLEYFLTEQLKYKKSEDYYRMDGTISPEVRTHMCDKFNKKSNTKVKVFIMSTKVGGLGLNLTAANRVIIMNVNWNPSYDTQSVFRSFRFGQKKAVYVYRLIAKDTMEEKMYQRVVTKLAIAHRVVDKHQITRHYSAADIQEFYSVRPTIDKDRPVPNVPEDRVLATLIQKCHFVYRWHEHQALLANRPEEDLDEHQKNAAWEEFNKKEPPPPVPAIQPTPLPNYVTASSILGRAGPSGLQNRANLPVSPQFKAGGPANKANGYNNVNVPSNSRHNLSKSTAAATRRSERLNKTSSPPSAVSLPAHRQVFTDNNGRSANNPSPQNASTNTYSLTLRKTPSGPKLVFKSNNFPSAQATEIPLKIASCDVSPINSAVVPSPSLAMPLIPLNFASYVVPPTSGASTNTTVPSPSSPSLRMTRGRTNTIKIINDLMQARTSSDQIAELRPASEHSSEDQNQANNIDELNSIISESLSQDGSWANDGMNDTLASLNFPD